MIPRSLIAPFVLLVLGLILPLLFQNAYVWSEATLMLTWATVALNWNLVFRIAGIYSFAQMIFFAAGGYTLAMLASHYGISPWIGIPAGSIVAALFGIAIGLACLRLPAPMWRCSLWPAPRPSTPSLLLIHPASDGRA